MKAALLLLLVLVAATAGAQAPLRDITEPVNDHAEVLSPEASSRIAEELVSLRARTGVQMAVLLVTTTEGEPIEDFSLRHATAWGGGSAGRDDGVLYVLAVDDRRMRLEVGYGVEPLLPDSAARSLLDQVQPALREQRYEDAINQVVAGVVAATRDPVTGRRATLPLGREWFVPLYLIVFVAAAASAIVALRRQGSGLDLQTLLRFGPALATLLFAFAIAGTGYRLAYLVVWACGAAAGGFCLNYFERGRMIRAAFATVCFIGAFFVIREVWSEADGPMGVAKLGASHLAIGGVMSIFAGMKRRRRHWYESYGSGGWSGGGSSGGGSWSGGGGSFGGGGASSSW